MNFWKNCTMTTLFHSAQVSSDWPCIVKIEGNKILVEYDDDGFVQYNGTDQGNGHFLLKSDEVRGKASLHMFAGATLMVGNWTEGGDRGMWQIQLA